MKQSFYVGSKAIIQTNKGILIVLDHRNKWELPGGRVDAGQSLVSALEREIAEEIIGAKDVSVADVVYSSIGDFEIGDKHRLCLVFFEVSVALPSKIELSDEHEGVNYISSSKDIERFNMYSSDAAAIRKWLSKT